MLSADMGLYYDFTVDEDTSKVSGYVKDENGDTVVSCPGLTGVDAKGNTAGLNAGRLPKY